MNSFKHISGKKILITGNTGFKGSWLTFFLKYLGCKVYGISDDDYEGIYKLSKTKDLLEKQYYFDLTKVSSKEIENLLKEISPNIVFHFAAQSLVKRAAIEPIKTIEINSLGTIKLLEAVNNCPSIELVTVATTDKVYAVPENLNKEEDNLFGSEFYSASKVAAENFISAFIKSLKRDDLKVATIRSGNVVGGGDRGDARIIPDIINAIYNDANLEIRNPGYIRPWTYVLDSLNGYVAASNYCIENNKNEIFNLNSETDNNHDVMFVLNTFLKLSDFQYKISEQIYPEFKEVKTLIIKSSKAKELLNWDSKFKLSTVVEKIYNWENYHQQKQDSKYSLKEVEEFFSK